MHNGLRLKPLCITEEGKSEKQWTVEMVSNNLILFIWFLPFHLSARGLFYPRKDSSVVRKANPPAQLPRPLPPPPPLLPFLLHETLASVLPPSASRCQVSSPLRKRRLFGSTFPLTAKIRLRCLRRHHRSPRRRQPRRPPPPVLGPPSAAPPPPASGGCPSKGLALLPLRLLI